MYNNNNKAEILKNKILALAEYAKQENPILEQCCNKKEQYKCEKCKDTGFIWTDEDTTILCECQIEKKRRKKLTAHGFTLNMLEKYSLENFKYNKNPISLKLHSVTKNFLNDFNNNNIYSLAFLGQSGCGKTHLLTSIGKILLSKDVDVRYYKFNTLIDKIKNDKISKNDTGIEKEATNCEVLIIDNFFVKDNLTPADKTIMFNILEYRYDNNLPVLIGSTLLLKNIVGEHIEIAGRLNEMCDRGEKIVEVIGKQYDYRFFNSNTCVGGDVIDC